MNPEWPLILFTFFLCLSGGILGAQGLLTVLGKGKKMQNVALIAALATLVIGGICVFMHLQHWERIFNAFGALLAGNGYGVSGITLELWGCVVEFIAIALFFLFARRAEDGVAPKWAGILAIIVGASHGHRRLLSDAVAAHVGYPASDRVLPDEHDLHGRPGRARDRRPHRRR